MSYALVVSPLKLTPTDGKSSRVIRHARALTSLGINVVLTAPDNQVVGENWRRLYDIPLESKRNRGGV